MYCDIFAAIKLPQRSLRSYCNPQAVCMVVSPNEVSALRHRPERAAHGQCLQRLACTRSSSSYSSENIINQNTSQEAVVRRRKRDSPYYSRFSFTLSLIVTVRHTPTWNRSIQRRDIRFKTVASLRLYSGVVARQSENNEEQSTCVTVTLYAVE